MPPGPVPNDVHYFYGHIILRILHHVHVGSLCGDPVWKGVSYGRYPEILLCGELFLLCGQGAAVADDAGVRIIFQG